jgi:hypothetical protein
MTSVIATPNLNSKDEADVISQNSCDGLPDIKATAIRTGYKITHTEWIFGVCCIIKNVGDAPMKIIDKIRVEAVGELKDEYGNFVQYDTFYGEGYPELQPGDSCGIYFTWDQEPYYMHPLGKIRFKCYVKTSFEEGNPDNNDVTRTFNHPEYQKWKLIIFGKLLVQNSRFFQRYPMIQILLNWLEK